jgi:hypothetical protein
MFPVVIPIACYHQQLWNWNVHFKHPNLHIIPHPLSCLLLEFPLHYSFTYWSCSTKHYLISFITRKEMSLTLVLQSRLFWEFHHVTFFISSLLILSIIYSMRL